MERAFIQILGLVMIIGFTGTQIGMTDFQKCKFYELLDDLHVKEFHHGDCIGADADAHNLVVEYFKNKLGVFTGKIIIHPPIKDIKRAFCKAKTILEPKDYISRNHDIVDASELIIATPKEFEEQMRSGTWATVRYTKKTNKRLIIIYPNE